MTGDPLRKLQTGDRLSGIPAAAWNAFVDAALYVRARQSTAGASTGEMQVGPGQVLVYNETSDDREQFEVLQISAPIVLPTVNEREFVARVALSCVAPTSNGSGSFVILAQPIPSGQIGVAWIDGVCPARVSGGGSWADTKNAEAAYLQAGDYGNARILWSEGGTSERWAVVRLNDRRGFILVQTVAGPDATPYPAEGDNPNVYRCQILSAASFTKAAGSQVLSYTPTGRYDHVMNLVDDHYIEEDSVLGALELDGQIYTMDKIRQAEIVVFGHSRGTTDVGTGTLSRIRPSNGEPIWTVDLGVDGASRPKIVYAVDLDSRGNVYAYWRSCNNTTGDAHARVDFAGGQGIKKYDRDGTELASLDLPNVNPSFPSLAGSLVTMNANVRVDPADDTRIYVGCDYDTDGFWLYRLDDSLTVQWGAGPTEVGASVLGRCCGVAVGNDGKVYASNTNGGVYQFLDDGTFVDDDSTFIRTDGMAIDPTTGRLKVTQDETDGAVAVGGYAAFPTTAFAKNRFDFPTPDSGAGTWTPGIGSNFRGSSCIATGAHVVSGSIIPMVYTPGVGGTGQASYLVTDAGGTPVASGAWPSTTTGGPIYGIAYNPSTGGVFVTGGGGQTGKIDYLVNGVTWSHQTYTSPAAGDERGWTIAARTCRL